MQRLTRYIRILYINRTDTFKTDTNQIVDIWLNLLLNTLSSPIDKISCFNICIANTRLKKIAQPITWDPYQQIVAHSNELLRVTGHWQVPPLTCLSTGICPMINGIEKHATNTESLSFNSLFRSRELRQTLRFNSGALW